MEPRGKHAMVVVFGDLGHSPRMKNHAKELTASGYTVEFIGYNESALPRDVLEDHNIKATFLPNIRIEIPLLPNLLARLLGIILKLMIQTVYFLWLAIWKAKKPNVILVQTPPVLPTIFVSWLAARWHGAKLIADWHNIGYTILLQSIKSPSIIAIAKSVELYLAKLPNVSLTVSKRLQGWLQVNGGVRSLVLYDRPDPSRFRKIVNSQRTEIRNKLLKGLDPKKVTFVSSTSWTPDEDFSILVEALRTADGKLSPDASINVIITGKGPLRDHYEKLIKELNFSNISFRTIWLSFEDYSNLLGVADYGICLHCSSSGMDLPMKAIDMIGAGLPIIAFEYDCIRELFVNENDGYLFKSSNQLAELILDIAFGRKKLIESRISESWHDHWEKVVLPLLD